MIDKSKKVTTQELWNRLFQSASAEKYLELNDEACDIPSFSEYISSLCETRGVKAETVIKRGDIETSFGHRLFSGARNPSRDTVLQIAFGFGMNIDETQQLLKVANAASLHPRIKRDAVIAYGLHNHKSIMEVQQILYENDLPLIGRNKDGKR